MISELRCTGFRSLFNFQLDIRPGLNVLVGPNGGGKTNILALISFISELSSKQVSDAINTCGGVSKVFRKITDRDFSKDLSISVTGRLPFEKSYYLPADYSHSLMSAGFVGLRYRWEFEINANRGFDDTFFNRQILKLSVLTSSLVTVREDEWHYEISCSSLDGISVNVDEHIHNREMYDILVHRRKGEDSIDIDAESLIKAEDWHSPLRTALYYALDWLPVARWIGRDLRSGTTFNFDPSVCKQPNDSAHPPTLAANGGGLAATLYAIHKASKEQDQGPSIWTPRQIFPKNINKRLLDYFKLINYTVTGFMAENDPLSNKITIFILVDGDGTKLKFPIEFASDGTVKWLVFLTALLTETSGFSLEEPENFLHPDMQRQVVDLIRSETEGRENLCVLMTTHSETLLNATRPEELIIVSMQSGVTASKRITNPALIDEEIFNTGFGLGYFYISGGVYE